MRCPNCPRLGEPRGLGLDDVRGKFCGSRGPINAALAILLEAPGKHELIDGRPVVAASGRILRAALGYGGVGLDSCYITNTINCYPLGADDVPTPEQLEACRPRLLRELSSLHARALLLLGNYALKAVTGFSGHRQSISYWRGYVLGRHDVEAPLPPSVELVTATYHPASIQRTGNMQYPWFRRDVYRAVRAVQGNLNLTEPPPLGRSLLGLDTARTLALDIETDMKSDRITRIGLATENGALSTKFDASGVYRSKEALAAPRTLKVVFNALFDIPRLRRAGLAVNGEVWDPLIAARLLDPDAPGYTLNEVASHYLDLRRWKHEGNPGSEPKKPKTTEHKTERACTTCGRLSKRWVTKAGVRQCASCIETVFTGAQGEHEKKEEVYNRNDAWYLLPLQKMQESELRETGQLELFRAMMRAWWVLCEMFETGIRVDPAERDRHARRLQKRAAWSLKRWQQFSDANPRSHPKVLSLLYETWGLPIQYKEENVGGQRVRKPTANAEALSDLGKLATPYRKAIRAIWRVRHYEKWVKTYTQISDRIHPSFSPGGKDEESGGKKFQVGTATRRIVAKGGRFFGRETPPLQQMPEALRTMFVPDSDEDVFLKADFSSQELRILAYRSGDRKLIERIESGFDIHAATAKALHCDRTRAKNAFYCWCFGGTWKALVAAFRQVGFDLSAAEAKAMLAYFDAEYPRVKKYHLEVLRLATAQGYLEDGWGARRYYYDVQQNRNEAINQCIQSSGSGMLWDSVEEVHARAKAVGGRLVFVAHDEVLVQVPRNRVVEYATWLRSYLEREFPQVAPGFHCPVSIKVGRSWFMDRNAEIKPENLERVA